MKKILSKIFSVFQKMKVNILPNHYYSNIPDFTFLNNENYWKEATSMVAIQGLDINPQIEFLKKCVASIKDKSILSNNNIHKTACLEEDRIGYGAIESDCLYAFINFVKPKKVVQIGCGVSTSVILRSCKKNDHNINLVCIEPYPSSYLKHLHQEGTIELINQKAQTVALEEIIDLDAGDLLFVDSTHTVKVGSEVNRIILEVLPRLKKGVFVHFHDIYFPYDYQRNINSTLFFWSESTLLHSFLINNSKFKIKVSQSILHYKAKNILKELFPNYNPQSENFGIPINRSLEFHFPSSTYLEVIN